MSQRNNPADQAAVLQQSFIDAVKQLEAIQQQLQRVRPIKRGGI